MAIRHIRDHLKPASLKIKITQDLELGINGLRKNWFAFLEHVLQCAQLCEQYVPIRQALHHEKATEKDQKPKTPVPWSSGRHKPTVQYKPFRRPGPEYVPGFQSTPYEKMNSTAARSQMRFSTPAPQYKPLPDCLQP